LSSSRESTVNRSQPPNRIDNAALYENIGNLVIESAYAGDKSCEIIYKRAYRKASGVST